ncbi:preprotein translocase subunit SecE [Faecalibacter macacae]|uniref:Protein translocase subunit SecE n=1 Tax=Faecalibacter macacae TaxID=1859289 RepID=A0A3L9MQ06_9FLAO|nr:preprotein translocase subunit SecE [Faecalibacter macacae]RLZ12669.1 preprotein translocase subunit SecE [Faecalibacter macacae]
MKIVNYIKESYVEFKDNVTWPSFSKLQQDTLIVAIATVLLAIFLYAVDTSFAKLLDVIYSAF